jgi:protease-4
VIDDMYQHFIGLVAERRHLPAAEVRLLADGRVFTGRQARAAGLIGALGGEQEARDWLAATHAVDADLPAADLDRPEAELPLFEALGRRLRAGLIPARLRLDGVISLWQGELGK